MKNLKAKLLGAAIVTGTSALIVGGAMLAGAPMWVALVAVAIFWAL